MADLFEAGDVPGDGAVGIGPQALPGELPPERLAPDAAPQPKLGVVGPAGKKRVIAHPELEPKEVGENVVISGEAPSPPLTPEEGGISAADKAAADYRMTHPDADSGEISAAIGMNKGSVTRALGKPAVKMYMSQWLNHVGATLEKAATVIKEGQEANKETPISYMGEIKDVHIQPDHDVRIKAAKLSMEAHGVLDEKVQVNIYQNLTDEQLAQVAIGVRKPQDFIETRPA